VRLGRGRRNPSRPRQFTSPSRLPTPARTAAKILPSPPEISDSIADVNQKTQPPKIPADLRAAQPPDRWDVAAGGAVFAVALAARVLYVYQIHRAGLGSYLRLDSLYYHDWAVRIAGGAWVGTEVFEMSPLYAYILAVFYKVLGQGALGPQILQACLGASVCGLLVTAGRRLFGKSAGVIAGAAFALYGPALFYDGQVMKTSLEVSFTSLMALCLLSAARPDGGFRRGRIFAGGALLGLTALMRENILLAAPLLAIWLLWPRRGRPLAQGAISAAILAAGAAVIILPVTARNILVAREPVLITSLGGENFYTGNNEQASGRYTPPPFVRPDPRFEHEDFRQEAARRAGRPLTRREVSSFWLREGLRFVLADPVRYAWLVWDKLVVFCNDFERPDNFSYDDFKEFSPLLRAPLLHFAWVAPLGILGIALSRRSFAQLLPVHITLFTFVASALIFFTQSRYRMPSVPLLCLFAGHAVVELFRAAKEKKVPMLAASGLALVGLTLFMTRDPGNTALFEAQNRAIVAEMHMEAGDLRKAEDVYRESLADLARLDAPGSVPVQRVEANAHLGLARALLASGKDEEGLRELTLAARSPRPEVRSGARRMLAMLRMQRGEIALAAAAAAKALEDAPDDFELRMLYAEALDRTGRRAEAIRQLDEALRIRPSDPDARRIRDAISGGR